MKFDNTLDKTYIHTKTKKMSISVKKLKLINFIFINIFILILNVFKLQAHKSCAK